MGVGRRTDNKQIIISGETCCGKAKTEQRRRGRHATRREVVMDNSFEQESQERLTEEQSRTGDTHVDIWGKSRPGTGNKCKDLQWEVPSRFYKSARKRVIIQKCCNGPTKQDRI